jgi:hypothetical protein
MREIPGERRDTRSRVEEERREMVIRTVVTLCPPWQGHSEHRPWDRLYSQLLLGHGSMGKGNPLEAGSYLNGQKGRNNEQNGESHRKKEEVCEVVRKSRNRCLAKAEGKELLKKGVRERDKGQRKGCDI